MTSVFQKLGQEFLQVWSFSADKYLEPTTLAGEGIFPTRRWQSAFLKLYLTDQLHKGFTSVMKEITKYWREINSCSILISCQCRQLCITVSIHECHVELVCGNKSLLECNIVLRSSMQTVKTSRACAVYAFEFHNLLAMYTYLRLKYCNVGCLPIPKSLNINVTERASFLFACILAMNRRAKFRSLGEKKEKGREIAFHVDSKICSYNKSCRYGR